MGFQLETRLAGAMIKILRANLARTNASSTVMICTVLPRPGSSPSSPPPSATHRLEQPAHALDLVVP